MSKLILGLSGIPPYTALLCEKSWVPFKASFTVIRLCVHFMFYFRKKDIHTAWVQNSFVVSINNCKYKCSKEKKVFKPIVPAGNFGMKGSME